MKRQCQPFVHRQQSPFGDGRVQPGFASVDCRKSPNTMQQGLAGAVIGSANSHASIKNREAAARGPIKFGKQVGMCRQQRPYDTAVESVEFAMGASRGRGRIGRTGEEADLTDIVAGPNKASRLLPESPMC